VRALAIFVGCLAMSVAMPAAAAKRSPADEARATLRAVSECAAANNAFYKYGVQLRNFMATSPFDPSLGKFDLAGWTFDELNYSVRDPKFAWATAIRDCMFQRRLANDEYVNSLSFTAVLLRGMMFRGLYRQQFGRTGTAAVQPPSAVPEWRVADDHGFTPLQQFGECVVQLNPQGSRDVLYAEAGSAGEADAYKRLASALNDCLTPGTTVRFSKGLIEGLLAEGLFHLSGGTLADPRKAKH
jgi:hypothetical protein